MDILLLFYDIPINERIEIIKDKLFVLKHRFVGVTAILYDLPNVEMDELPLRIQGVHKRKTIFINCSKLKKK